MTQRLPGLRLEFIQLTVVVGAPLIGQSDLQIHSQLFCWPSTLYIGKTMPVLNYHVLFCVFQVLIFAEKKQDVDAIHEYLLLKGVEAVSIHGGKGLSYIHTILSSEVKGHVPSYSDMCILPDYYFR